MVRLGSWKGVRRSYLSGFPALLPQHDSSMGLPTQRPVLRLTAVVAGSTVEPLRSCYCVTYCCPCPLALTPPQVRVCIALPARLTNLAVSTVLYVRTGTAPTVSEALLLSCSCHGLGLLLQHALESHYRRGFELAMSAAAATAAVAKALEEAEGSREEGRGEAADGGAGARAGEGEGEGEAMGGQGVTAQGEVGAGGEVARVGEPGSSLLG